jgi:hypothetical protein
MRVVCGARISRSLSSGAHSRDPLAHPGYGTADFVADCVTHAGPVCAIVPSSRKKIREDAMPHTLVPSDRVEHANVYGQDGAKLGTIERLMLDKTSGTVAYAVIKTGGMLASHHHYPVRWDALKFDPARQAFVVELTLEDLRAGPSEFDEDDFDWGDRSRSYPHPHYWTV